jgi:ABC-type transport system involved in multi-copper enzyme maturation permease subunit
MMKGPAERMRGTFVIAHLTWLEARRRRVALAALLCGLLFLLAYGTAVFFLQRNLPTPPPPAFVRQGQLMFITIAGLYVVNFLTIALAVLLPVDTLSGEISSGVMQTLASKPISRADIVLGKWLAHAAITAGYLLFMSAGVVLIVAFFTGFKQPGMARALPLMWLSALSLLTICIAGGTRFSTVTNGIVAFAFYGLAFIGGWVEQIGAFTGTASARYIGTAISLVSPCDALWRLAAHQLQPPVVGQLLQLTPFSAVSPPSAAMVVWSVGLIVVVVLLALRSFQRRAL